MNAPNNTLMFPAPLRVAPDMHSNWSDTDTDFDTAAERFIGKHRDDGEVNDLPIPDLRTWGMKADDGVIALKPITGHRDALQLRSTAFSNLAARLGAPVDFVRDRLTAPLQVATMNYLLATQDKPMSGMLRLRGNEVSAIVSDRYAPLEPEELVDTLRAALNEHGMLSEVRVRSLATGPVDVLRLILPAEEKPVRVGDVSNVGLDISSSCFGKSAVHVRGMVWRLVCLNGLRTPSQMGHFSYRHIGDSQRLKNGLFEAVPTALAHARGLMGKWQDAVGVFIDDVAAHIAAMQALTITERERVETQLIVSNSVPQLPERTSLYDFVNALTGAAHEAEPARRLELETLAGDVLHQELRRAS